MQQGSSVASDIVGALAAAGLDLHTLPDSDASEWKHLLTSNPSSAKVLFPLLHSAVPPDGSEVMKKAMFSSAIISIL